MIDENTKRAVLEEILKSDSFKNSKLNSKLLSYLVECSIRNITPTEYSIAIDVFGKDSSFNPTEDTIVRVSVYNLRKKLERYYANTGKKAKVRVKIPKGHYEVQFFNYSKESVLNKLKNPFLFFVPLTVILAATVIFLLVKLSQLNSKPIPSGGDEEIYNLYADFIQSKNPKLISLGDDFIYFSDFSEFNTTEVRKMFRNSKINSVEEFEKFKAEDPSRENFKKLPFSFFNQAAVWPLPYIVKLLDPFGTKYIIKSASTLTSNDLKNNDIIFLGSFWTLGILSKILEDLEIDYNIIGKEKLVLKRGFNRKTGKIYIREGVPAYDHIDYCLFLKVPGPNGNPIYSFVSFYATGSVGAVKYMTDKNSLKKLKEKFNNKFPEYFMVLFKSTGYAREVLSTDVLYTEPVSPSRMKW